MKIFSFLRNERDGNTICSNLIFCLDIWKVVFVLVHHRKKSIQFAFKPLLEWKHQHYRECQCDIIKSVNLIFCHQVELSSFWISLFFFRTVPTVNITIQNKYKYAMWTHNKNEIADMTVYCDYIRFVVYFT